MSGGGRPGVLVDRDGTLIEEVGYLNRVDRVVFFPWTIDAIRALNRAGLPIAVVSNQSGVARGMFDESTVNQVHARIGDLLAVGGARVDAYYYCPHHPDGSVEGYARACDCRKPRRGLVDRAARELGIDPSRSFVVGDRWIDVELARTVGARGVLVRTGYGSIEEARRPEDLVPDFVTDNFMSAVSWILARVARGSDTPS
jgi:D-glycero-D-manno-heptose 1,7-bisphosphate phosphatase